MAQETGDPRYRQSAIRAAEYTWANYGSRGLFIGGASDNPNITDKEAGLLSPEAFLSLYEDNKDPKWLDRAKAAGDFAESWIWIWNLPMPADADNAQLHWKRVSPRSAFRESRPCMQAVRMSISTALSACMHDSTTTQAILTT